MASYDTSVDDKELVDVVALLDAQTSLTKECVHVEPLLVQTLEIKVNI